MSSKRPPAPQAGILNRPTDHLLLAAYNLSGDPATVRAALERLRELVHRELRSKLDETTAQSPKDQPSAETGELGFTSGFDRYHLTITVGYGTGLFDKLGIAPEQRPSDLIAIPWAWLSDQPSQSAENGDLALQVCSDSLYVAEHVLRRVGEELGDLLLPAWSTLGEQRHTSRAGRTSREEGRALIGFKDGTANLNPRHDADAANLVWVDPDRCAEYPPAQPVDAPGQPSPYGGPVAPTFPTDLRVPPTREPEWTRGGTYMVARASTIDIAAWDKRPLGDQEHAVGRFKTSGAPLHASDDDAGAEVEPDFTSDPDGATTPLTAHVRKTGPRTPGDQDRRVFRRGYPLIAAPGAGGLSRGLIFICFARTISSQFEFITRAWTANPDFPRPGTGIDALRAGEQVLCGGYFFVPALEKTNQPWSFVLPPVS